MSLYYLLASMIFLLKPVFSLSIPPKMNFFGLFAFSRAAPVAYGGSQARGLIRAVAAHLYHSHSNARSESHLQTTPQLMAMLDP